MGLKNNFLLAPFATVVVLRIVLVSDRLQFYLALSWSHTKGILFQDETIGLLTSLLWLNIKLPTSNATVNFTHLIESETRRSCDYTGRDVNQIFCNKFLLDKLQRIHLWTSLDHTAPKEILEILPTY